MIHVVLKGGPHDGTIVRLKAHLPVLEMADPLPLEVTLNNVVRARCEDDKMTVSVYRRKVFCHGLQEWIEYVYDCQKEKK